MFYINNYDGKLCKEDFNMIEINVENFITIAIVAIIVAWIWDKWLKNFLAKTPLGV